MSSTHNNTHNDINHQNQIIHALSERLIMCRAINLTVTVTATALSAIESVTQTTQNTPHTIPKTSHLNHVQIASISYLKTLDMKK